MVDLKRSIKGYVERHSNEHGLSGWCFYIDCQDELKDNPVEIHVYAGNILLRKITAAGYRDDILHAYSVRRSGFCLGLSKDVLKCIPKGTVLRLRDKKGNDLSLERGSNFEPIGYAEDDGAKLLEAFKVGKFIDKWGSFKLPFSARPEKRCSYMDAIIKVQELFYERLGLNATPAYGTLLGMARNGRFIDHDDDVDLMVEIPYFSFDEMMEYLYDKLSLLAEDGHQISVVSPAQFHIKIKGTNLPMIDMFVAWQEPDYFFYTYFGVGGSLGEPLTYQTGLLEGRNVVVASCMERILELSYGPNWRSPDPDFQWSVPSSLRSRMNELHDAGLKPSRAFVNSLKKLNS